MATLVVIIRACITSHHIVTCGGIISAISRACTTAGRARALFPLRIREFYRTKSPLHNLRLDYQIQYPIINYSIIIILLPRSSALILMLDCIHLLMCLVSWHGRRDAADEAKIHSVRYDSAGDRRCLPAVLPPRASGRGRLCLK